MSTYTCVYQKERNGWPPLAIYENIIFSKFLFRRYQWPKNGRKSAKFLQCREHCANNMQTKLIFLIPLCESELDWTLSYFSFCTYCMYFHFCFCFFSWINRINICAIIVRIKKCKSIFKKKKKKHDKTALSAKTSSDCMKVSISRPLPLRESCPYSEFFRSVFSRIWTEYGKIRSTGKIMVKYN